MLPALSVLVVDDDPDIRDLVVGYLEANGCVASACASGEEAIGALRAAPIDIVLLDLNLGAEHGLDVARELRTWWQGGLIIVTGRGDLVDRVVGLEIGADDYVAKPFELRELLARIRSLARRVRRDESTVNRTGSAPAAAGPRCHRLAGFRLDEERRTLTAADGREILLTTGEFDLLCVLARHAGRVLSRDELLSLTHGREAGPFDRTIDVMIGRLRRKLGDTAAHPRIIKTVRGGGYLLVAANDSTERPQ
ncbi:MAG: response regulator transcription factor [Casimicrobiaceae bacterium]